MSETKVQRYEQIANALRAHGIDEARIQLYVEYHQQGRFERADNILNKVTCAARRRRDGLPCLSAPNPPYKYCRFHGGVSKKGCMSPEGLERCRQARLRGLETMRLKRALGLVLNRPHTPESREKMRQSALRRWARVRGDD
jgi:hypothetical protein